MSDFSAAQAAPGSGTFSVGAVLKRSFSTFFANIVPFGVLALILYLPTLIYGFVSLDALERGVAPDYSAGDIIITLLSFVLTYVVVGALVYGTVQHLSGQKASLGTIISRGLSTIVPVIVIAILLSLVVGVGFALLIVPGIFLIVAYAVVIPAAVVERPGIIGSFKRSWELTKGYRWSVLGILLVLAVILFILAAVVGSVAGIVAFTMGDFTLLIIVNYVVSAISGALMSVALAVTYHDLRVAKEGVSTAQIAAVFD
ncbi:MAG: hypothetical protein GEU89_10565 [Kiloniellaceae bacterium]|jgi:hypothetical protein|nr:hypothetical protein [Kiloniellaceae bacterium]